MAAGAAGRVLEFEAFIAQRAHRVAQREAVRGDAAGQRDRHRERDEPGRYAHHQRDAEVVLGEEHLLRRGQHPGDHRQDREHGYDEQLQAHRAAAQHAQHEQSQHADADRTAATDQDDQDVVAHWCAPEGGPGRAGSMDGWDGEPGR